MDEELRRLIALADAYAQTGEQVSAVFAQELAAVYQQAERALNALILKARTGDLAAATTAARALVLRNQIRQLLEDAGFDVLMSAAVPHAVGTFADVNLAASTMRARASTVLNPLNAYAVQDIATLFTLGDDAANALWRALSDYLLTDQTRTDILDKLAQVLDGSRARVQSTFDTATAILGRRIEQAATEDLGPDQPFLYVGPIDSVTRDFCLDHVGQVFSRKAIDEMDNGQIPDVFTSGGGYNCRHSWMAVESQELRAMADTGEAIEPIAGNVTRAKTRKIQERIAKQEAKRKRAA